MIGLSQKTKNRLAWLVAAIMVAWAAGWIDPFETIPIWWRLVATGAALAAIGGYSAAGRIHGMLPDEEGIYLLAFRSDEEAGAMWELSEDQWADLEVHGSLKPWEESPKRVYECREYDPDRNVAIGNWRESVAGSTLAAEATVDDVMALIRELRNDLEPAAAEAREMKRRIRGIVRTLDSERFEAQQAVVDEHIAPNIGGSATISEVIDDHLGDLHPEARDDDLEQRAAARSPHPEGDEISFDVLEDTDALEPVATDGGKHE